MCCILLVSDEPCKDESGRYFTVYGNGRVHFQTNLLVKLVASNYIVCRTHNGDLRPVLFLTMQDAPFMSCMSFGWCLLQFVPATSGCAQYCLRRKVLKYDMSRYSCFQGYFSCCCLRAGGCGEQNCPTFCAFLEACLCST